MPRGLGDNPLSRGKKKKSAVSHPETEPSVHVDVSSGASQSPTEQFAPESASSSSASGSYNDVFFQRREETQAVAAANGPTAPVVEAEASIAAPIAAAEAYTVEVIPEPAVPEPVETTPVAEPAPVFQETTFQDEVPSDAAPVQTTVTPEAPLQEEPKGGFFSRIFGKLRK